MAGLKLSDKARHLFEAVFTALLFGTQTILNAGLFMGIMMIPLLPYLWALLSDAMYTHWDSIFTLCYSPKSFGLVG